MVHINSTLVRNSAKNMVSLLPSSCTMDIENILMQQDSRWDQQDVLALDILQVIFVSMSMALLHTLAYLELNSHKDDHL